MADSSSFDLLSYGVQRWVYRQGWQSLRPVQEKAIPIVLGGEEDILLTAPTAGGKTEAAFLPVVSWLEDEGPDSGYGVICLSPLKALINDQYNRLDLLCESANTAITPWHGDVSQSVKRRSWASPQGILMITPESIEAMFVRRPHEMKARFASVKYVVIDEFHAFIGRDRGQQLLSLLTRIENLVGKSLTRIALSATIGDTDMALRYLRPDQSRPGIHLDVSHDKMKLQLALKGFSEDEDKLPPLYPMARYLFNTLRGDSHLIFANSRRKVEELVDLLSSQCEAKSLPNEFFPHHGSLSRDVRHFVESRLKEGEKPTTAIATSTLELGIDIGDVVSVGQIEAPSNCSSLRQRLGRSGRREGAAAILRVLVSARGDGREPSTCDRLEFPVIQSVAVLELLLERWIEPPDTGSYHLSTMVQQLLSMINFTGGITAATAYDILCRRGPWQNVSPDLFARFLRSVAQKDVIAQLPTGELIVGVEGEKELGKHTFYTAFETPEEFKLVANGRNIGSIPIDNPMVEGQLLLFGGRRWTVVGVDLEAKVITLKRASGGVAPRFGGDAAPVHGAIRSKMRSVFESGDEPAYCDPHAATLLQRARRYYAEYGFLREPVVEVGNDIIWLVWAGPRVQNTLFIVATLAEIAVETSDIALIFSASRTPEELILDIYNWLSDHSAREIEAQVLSVPIGKFGHLLDESLQREYFVSEMLDIVGASVYLEQLLASIRTKAGTI